MDLTLAVIGTDDGAEIVWPSIEVNAEIGDDGVAHVEPLYALDGANDCPITPSGGLDDLFIETVDEEPPEKREGEIVELISNGVRAGGIDRLREGDWQDAGYTLRSQPERGLRAVSGDHSGVLAA